ncbi:MAG: protein-L-isoaspartate O-methyltransferase family protein [Alphaproteobacteria bacterium]
MDFANARKKMVDCQLRTEDVTDRDILAAMGEVPRELFVPARMKELAYVDADLEIGEIGGETRYLMESAPFGRLLQLANFSGEEFVLDIGCGTGYSTAVLARLAASVVGLEADEAMAAQASAMLSDLEADNAAVVSGPLEAGYADESPYDVIIVEGAVEVVPEALFAQLRDHGRLIVVVGRGRTGNATVYTKTGSGIGAHAVFDADVPSLKSFERPPAFVF